MQIGLVECYARFCRYRKAAEDSGSLDLSDIGFIYPSTLLPAIGLLSHQIGFVPPQDASIAKYVETARKGKAIGTVCPIVELPKESDKYGQIIQNLYEIHLNNGRNCGGANAFKYAVGELTDNIYQHSRFCHAFVMGQSYPRMNFTEICIMDDGKSIPGTFSEHGLAFENDANAVVGAIRGASTKQKEEGRGMGLGSTMNLIVHGLGGEIFIASRKGAVFLSIGKKQIYTLPDDLRFDGTLVSFRIPYTKEPFEQYLKYVEKHIEI